MAVQCATFRFAWKVMLSCAPCSADGQEAHGNRCEPKTNELRPPDALG